MIHAFIDLIVSQTPPPQMSVGTDAAATIAATVTAVGGSMIGLVQLGKRLLRKWVSSHDDQLVKILNRQTELLEGMQRELGSQVKVTARIATEISESSKALREVTHQLDRQQDRMGHLETLVVMRHDG